MIARNLRKIADQLRANAEESVIDREALRLAVRRLVAQADMLEEGLDVPEQVSA